MKLQRIIKEHPLVLLVGVVIAACTVTAGVIGYFETQKTAMTEMKHAAQILDLQSRLGAIERRMGGQIQFFDVTKLIVSRDKVKAIPAPVNYFQDTDFYTSTSINDEGWAHAKASEAELIRLTFGDDYLKQMQTLAPGTVAALDSSRLHLWKGPGVMRLRFPKGRAMERMDLHPLVVVQRLDMETLRKVTGKALREFIGQSDTDVAASKLILKELASKSGERDPRKSGDEPTDVVNDVLKALDNVYKSDITGWMLGIQVVLGHQLAAVDGKTSFRVLNAQKKGNVLYLQTQLVFGDVEIDSLGKDRRTVYLDKELFFVSDLNGVLFVQASVPSLDGRSQANAWVTKWLGGLYVPFD